MPLSLPSVSRPEKDLPCFLSNHISHLSAFGESKLYVLLPPAVNPRPLPRTYRYTPPVIMHSPLTCYVVVIRVTDFLFNLPYLIRCRRHMNHVLEINSDKQYARVQPAVLLDKLLNELEHRGQTLDYGHLPFYCNLTVAGVCIVRC